MNATSRAWTSADYRTAAAIMALMGGFFWAIRGTAGYGGEMGGMLAGFGWAVLWYGFSQVGDGAERRPYGHPWMIVAITLGIAYGGFTGYGVYISWLQGKFYADHPNLMREVPAWTGYAMLFVCGLHWGGNAGCFMAWCAPAKPVKGRDWLLRLCCGVAGMAVISVVVRSLPQLFLPFYSEGIYAIPEYKTCIRALDSLHTIAPHVGVLFGFFAFELARGDRRAAALILTMALGFAVPFALGGYWQTFKDSGLELSWWKNWEMTIGLGGGLAFGAAFWLFNRPADAVRVTMGARSRAFFRSGIPCVFPSLVIVLGAIDGRCRLHGVTIPPMLIFGAMALGLAVLSAAWVWRATRNTGDAAPEEYRVSFQALAAYIGLIAVAGWVVSIPTEWRLANVVLAALYVIYLGSSALLLAVMRHRFRRSA